MFFSIVVPVYKVENYLDRCVKSVLNQDFTDYELILVDDGSPDKAPVNCDRYGAIDNRLIIVHSDNKGASSARNIGIEIASGEYLLFLDSDDLWNRDDALTTIYYYIMQEKYPDLLCYGTSLFDEDNNQIKDRVPGAVCGEIYDRLQQLVKRNEYISPAYVKALNRNYVRANCLYFVTGIVAEDIEWSGRILECLKSVGVCPISFYKRIRRRDESVTANIGLKHINDILTALEIGVERICLLDKNESIKSIYYEYWAYQYAMLLSLAYCSKNSIDYNEIIGRLESLKWLLRYDHVNKVRAVRVMVAIFGVRLTVELLALRR